MAAPRHGGAARVVGAQRRCRSAGHAPHAAACRQVIPVGGGAAPVGGFGNDPAMRRTKVRRAAGLSGAGVGLTIPSLLGAGSAGLPAAHFGTGSGILNMVRQVGTVLGVAGLVAALSVPAADPLPAIRHGVVLVIAFFVAAGAVCLAVLVRRARPAPVVAALPDPRPQ